MTINVLMTPEHAQTIRKALVKQLQRAKQANDDAEVQRCKDVLLVLDMKLEGK